jgi:hypothetical protein
MSIFIAEQIFHPGNNLLAMNEQFESLATFKGYQAPFPFFTITFHFSLVWISGAYYDTFLQFHNYMLSGL